MSTPANYKTLNGLLRATERVLQQRADGQSRFDGMSSGMWLHNAGYAAAKFDAEDKVAQLIAKWSTSRPQDLQGGHALFGFALPRREYIAGDNVPGVGLIEDCTETQVCISGQWYHRSIFDAHSG